jgi:hypothetical protein
MNIRLALALLVPFAGCTNSGPAPESAAAALAPWSAPPHRPADLDKRRHPAPHVTESAVTRSRRIGPAAPPVVPNAFNPPGLTYNGGPLIDSPEIYAVFWGSNVDPATVSGLPGFYSAITSDAPYMQMLSEYDTGSYVLGHGTYMASVVDAAAPQGVFDATNNTYTVQDLDVQAELAHLIDTGKLPAPNGHNIFMVYFDA